MRKKLLVLLATFGILFVLARPLVSVSLDDFGFAVSVRQSTGQKFAPLFVW